MSNFRIRVAAVLGAMAVAVGALAAAGPASASAGLDINARPFAAQAKHIGLTASQAAELQRRVNGYLKKLGGKQVAINEIQLHGGALILTLPGEATVRDLTGASPSFDNHGCPYLYFCAYRYPNYYGDMLKFYNCGQNYPMPFANDGSYVNDQSNFEYAKFLDRNQQTLDYSVEAQGSYSPYDWTPVYYVDPCF